MIGEHDAVVTPSKLTLERCKVSLTLLELRPNKELFAPTVKLSEMPSHKPDDPEKKAGVVCGAWVRLTPGFEP